MSRGRFVAALSCASLALAALAAGGSAKGTGGVELRGLGTFEQPVHVAGAREYPRLLFVVEQAGVIRVLHRGRTLATPFLDIRDRTNCGDDPPACREEGLLSVAFPPDYRETRRFYVYYVDAEGNLAIDEFRRSSRRPTVAVPGSRRPVLGIAHPSFVNHNGGQLLFRGPLLYAGVGDGGSQGDPPGNAQNRDALLGKILRIDPRPSKRGRPYRVPRSNPFVGAPGRDEIFSFGLRNPFRFSFQEFARRPDRIVIGDVGQRRYEEIDYTTLATARGGNFGWDAFEGFARYDCGSQCPSGGTPDPGVTIPPIFAYPHSALAGPDEPSGCSVTGGFIVRDDSLTPLLGRYVYADYCAGEIRSFVPRLAGAADDQATGLAPGAVSSFGETPDGRLFVTSLNGGLFRIASSG